MRNIIETELYQSVITLLAENAWYGVFHASKYTHVCQVFIQFTWIITINDEQAQNYSANAVEHIVGTLVHHQALNGL